MTSPTYRPELGVLPSRIARLQVDRGYPVPWFVTIIDGKPEFRVMDATKFVRAIKEKRCWVCGDSLGKWMAFVIGPMCSVNRTSAEPPCHYECAVWSAKHCPFLSRPRMVRRENDLPVSDGHGFAAIPRNPGVGGVWVTDRYTLFKCGEASASGWLLEMGEPSRVEWYAEGRPATRDEVAASIDSGLPLLEAFCEKEQTPAAVREAHSALARARAAVDRLLPVAIEASELQTAEAPR